MKVTYNLIENGCVTNTQTKELDGPVEGHLALIHSDQFDGMDPGQMARERKPVVWVEAIVGGVSK